MCAYICCFWICVCVCARKTLDLCLLVSMFHSQQIADVIFKLMEDAQIGRFRVCFGRLKLSIELVCWSRSICVSQSQLRLHWVRGESFSILCTDNLIKSGKMMQLLSIGWTLEQTDAGIRVNIESRNIVRWIRKSWAFEKIRRTCHFRSSSYHPPLEFILKKIQKKKWLEKLRAKRKCIKQKH